MFIRLFISFEGWFWWFWLEYAWFGALMLYWWMCNSVVIASFLGFDSLLCIYLLLWFCFGMMFSGLLVVGLVMVRTARLCTFVGVLYCVDLVCCMLWFVCFDSLLFCLHWFCDVLLVVCFVGNSVSLCCYVLFGCLFFDNVVLLTVVCFVCGLVVNCKWCFIVSLCFYGVVLNLVFV